MGFFGKPERIDYVSNLTPGQQGISNQLIQAMQSPGAGGGYGTAADYYRSLFSDDSSTLNQMVAPEMRRFNEQTIPDLAEQFAGMGSGGLSSSGFQNASVNAGTDLAERIAAIRAGLREQGAAGLAGLGSQAMQPTMTPIHRPATEGFGGGLLNSAATGLGTAFAGPLGGMLGGLANQFTQSLFKPKMNSASIS